MNTGFTEKLKKETQNLYNTKSLWNYKGLITSMNEILKNTRPLSTGYSTRALMHALFSKYPKTRYFFYIKKVGILWGGMQELRGY